MNLRLLGYIIILCSNLGLLPVSAHEVKVSGEVGATLHIEPDDQAKAGESVQAWFILTQAGGQVIPFSQCNCQLSVYKQPIATNPKPILQPVLKSVNAEQYQGMPGTDIIFPSIGVYELKLSGSAKSPATFPAFELSYPVTVAAGKSTPITPMPQATQSASPEAITSKPAAVTTPPEPDRQSNLAVIVGAIAAVIVVAGGGFWLAKNKQQ